MAKLLFDQGTRHVTAEQLYAEARAAKIRVTLATVYNTLNQFIEAGLLREVIVDSQRTYFDTNSAHHYHFFFEECGRLVDIPSEAIKFAHLPVPPEGNHIQRIDVTIRIGENSG